MINPIPIYIQQFAGNVQIIDDFESQFQLHSSSGNAQFEIWYYGDLLMIEGEEMPYITGSTARIVAKDPLSAEEILLFDATLHGYNALFCEAYTENHRDNRPLKKYNLPETEVVLSFFYNIDYDGEIDDYEVDEQENVQLINGETTNWETIKRKAMMHLLFILKKKMEHF